MRTNAPLVWKQPALLNRTRVCPLNWCPSLCAIVQIFHTDGVWSCSKTSTDVRCEPQPDNCAKHDLRLGSTMQDDLLSWSARWIASALFRRM
uniref:Uncharacterized protein n=1 Tax=Ralstonia solanacearum TaxID=305 RepID=A0A0S4VUR6_RALSL|nr:protein of unknown function [Ralstonia solanacearum]CUV34271.1 protein of unknown function [Ralstonia solanacearum]CUV38275.1 protein of unknown function [Ralstonia solanacearum]CUV62875.1 protein of unknown function [Ralstonia solanacearum]